MQSRRHLKLLRTQQVVRHVENMIRQTEWWRTLDALDMLVADITEAHRCLQLKHGRLARKTRQLEVVIAALHKQHIGHNKLIQKMNAAMQELSDQLGILCTSCTVEID